MGWDKFKHFSQQQHSSIHCSTKVDQKGNFHWTELGHHSSSLQSCGMYSKFPYSKSSLLIDFYIKSRLKGELMDSAMLLVLTTSWRVSFRQINPMCQYKVDTYNILNWILLYILVQNSPQPYEVKAELIDSLPYRKCFILNSAKTGRAKFFDFSRFGIFANNKQIIIK